MTCDCGSPARYGHRCGPCHRAAVPLDERLRMGAVVAPAPVPTEVDVLAPKPQRRRAKTSAGVRYEGTCRRCERVRIVWARELCIPCYRSASRAGTLATDGAPVRSGYEGRGRAASTTETT